MQRALEKLRTVNAARAATMRLEPQHDLRRSDRAGIEIAEGLWPLGQWSLLHPVEGAEPAARNRIESFAEFERRIAIGAGENDFL